jgi:Fur family transcriptional regulator, stress-responsive regulator
VDTVIDLETTLRDAGLRVTAPRVAVMRALETHPHADADEVFQAIADALPGTSLQAVYVVLGALTEAGLVRRIEPAGSPARYERRIGDNHHHVVCTRCGAVDDVDCVHGEAPCLTPSSTGGFAITTAEVTFWGLCPACQAADALVRD